MTHAFSRRPVTTGLAAAVAAIPATAIATAAPRISPEERVRRALEEARLAFEAYYPGATFHQATWNEARPDKLASDNSVACLLVIASSYSEEVARGKKL